MKLANKIDYCKCVVDNAMCSELNFLKYTIYKLNDCCNGVYQSKIICDDILQTAITTKNCKAKWKKRKKIQDYRQQGINLIIIVMYPDIMLQSKYIYIFFFQGVTIYILI